MSKERDSTERKIRPLEPGENLVFLENNRIYTVFLELNALPFGEEDV